tara:strand:+ start:811 stop:1380 length:570 start_codon:yes stop_codon:yes gene_type:complete
VYNCNRKSEARGYCNTHYVRWRKYGDPNTLIVGPRKNCSISDCTQITVGYGYCGKHYQRWKAHGDPNTVKIREGGSGTIKGGYKAYRVKDGHIFEHRLVMEKKLGRKLRSGEIVHHTDGVKLNNTEDNLELTNRRDHTRHHLSFYGLDSICKFSDCEDRAIARNLCGKHYMVVKRKTKSKFNINFQKVV